MSKRWRKFERVDPDSVGLEPPAGCVAVWQNAHLLAFVYEECETWLGRTTLVMFRAAEKRRHARQDHSWAMFQRAKRELFGDVLALEAYPPARYLVDDANLYWLWIVHDEKPDLYTQWKQR